MLGGVDKDTEAYVLALQKPNGIFPLIVGINNITELEPMHVARILAATLIYRQCPLASQRQ